MGNANFLKGIPHEVISKSQVERHRRLPRMEDHLVNASSPREFLARSHEPTPQPLPLLAFGHGDLAHLHLSLMRNKAQRREGFPFVENRNLNFSLFRGKLLGREIKP